MFLPSTTLTGSGSGFLGSSFFFSEDLLVAGFVAHELSSSSSLSRPANGSSSSNSKKS